MEPRSKRVVSLFVVLAFLSACASTPRDRVAYNSISAAAEGVNTAMRTFNDLYQAGKATEDQRAQVLAAYAKYQAVALVAVKVAPGATAPDANLLAVALDSAASVVELIRLLTGK